MKLSRRRLLGSGIGLAGAAVADIAWGQAAQIKGLFVVLTGLETLDPIALTAVGASFADQGIPCVVTLPSLLPDALDPLAIARLCKLAADHPALVELMPRHLLAPNPERYLQLRAATRLRETLAPFLRDLGGADVAPISIMIDDPAGVFAPFAWRSAGFRVHLQPDDNGDAGTAVDALDWGVLQLRGGTHAPAGDAPEPWLAQLEALSGDQLLTIDFAGGEGADAAALAARWSAAVIRAALEGQFFPVRPADYVLQGHPGASKLVALLLDPGEGVLVDDGISAFMAELTQAGLPFTLWARRDGDPRVEGYDHCIDATDTPGLCRLVAGQGALGEDDGAEIVLELGSEDGLIGPRADGRFAAAVLDGAGLDQRLATAPMRDEVAVLRPAQVATQFQRRGLLRAITQAHYDGRAHFRTVADFVAELLAPDPVLAKFHATRRRMVSDPPGVLTFDAKETDALMQDAALAWRFIDRFTSATTGLCAGTVLWGPSKTINRDVTMWDVASQINGIIAAAALGLVGGDEAKDRLERLLAHLPTDSAGGASLPPRQFDSSTLEPSIRGFDSCDMGRFLISLHRAVAAGLVTEDLAQATLARWDLPFVIRDGRAFNNQGRQWIDVTMSHCTPYSHNGYAFWGMDVASAYDDFSADGDGDDRLGLLYNAARIGHYGTEPILLQALELGHTPQSRYLADVLFDAQLTWFEETGLYKCVSEVPLDFDPWFTYQGLRVDLEGQMQWVIATRSRNTAYWTDEFRSRADMISAKSAYLWASAYPHDYSRHLLELVREKGRVEDAGFSVGLNAQRLTQVQNYCDLNTNGIILTAIASMVGVG